MNAPCEVGPLAVNPRSFSHTLTSSKPDPPNRPDDFSSIPSVRAGNR